MLFILFIILGAIWGSFANVCIYRLPNSMGVVLKSSFCPSCKDNIRWFNNIPIISFILLQGKCRSCKQAIDKQYLIVELITSLSFVTIYYFFGLTITSLLLLILFVFFIIIFFIDLKHFIIPDSLTFPLMIIGFLKSSAEILVWSVCPEAIQSLSDMASTAPKAQHDPHPD